MQTHGMYCPRKNFFNIDDCILINRKAIKTYVTRIMTLKFTAIVPWKKKHHSTEKREKEKWRDRERNRKVSRGYLDGTTWVVD